MFLVFNSDVSRKLWHNVRQIKREISSCLSSNTVDLIDRKANLTMTELYIGLISGTSADGIDAALVEFQHDKPELLATHYTPYHPALREKILALCTPGENEIQRMGELDVLLGDEFAKATNQLLQKNSLPADNINAIGSHGQNIRHSPRGEYRYTIQIGDPNIIATKTGITTVADFRRKDVALGGQGAPLVPAFHQCVFGKSKSNQVIVNIGGIANITVLTPSSTNVTGYDTGPGNALMDAWIQQHQQSPHDVRGQWGAQGTTSSVLLKKLLSDPYFKLAAPKSTGREYFHLAWLQKYLNGLTISPIDIQATLAEFTATTILNAISQHFDHGDIFVCGGGAHNDFLMQRLQLLGENKFKITSTKQLGIDPDWVEAMAFAWLARQTLHHRTGNLPSVTGANSAAILGGVYFAK